MKGDMQFTSHYIYTRQVDPSHENYKKVKEKGPGPWYSASCMVP